MQTETLPQAVHSEDRSLVFGTAEPSGIITKATKIANSLMPLIEDRKLYKVIGPRKHVYVEGWNTMLAMLGVFPSLAYSKRLERPDEIAYSARVELKHLSGAVVGAGEALCSSTEGNWKSKDEFQISSMAQTRATGKAARLSFSWIMNLAGYAEVPAEEMVEGEEKPTLREPQAKTTTTVPAETSDSTRETQGESLTTYFIPKAYFEKGGRYGVKDSNDKWYSTKDANLGELLRSAKENKVKLKIVYFINGDFRNIEEATQE